MGRTEFHGRNTSDDDLDPDRFVPRHVKRAASPSIFSVQIFPNSDTVRFVARESISELDSDDLDLLIESLQEARDFLDSH